MFPGFGIGLGAFTVYWAAESGMKAVANRGKEDHHDHHEEHYTAPVEVGYQAFRLKSE